MLLSGVIAEKAGDQGESTSTSVCVMRELMVFSGAGDAVRRFRYAIDTLKAGQARWPNVPDELRGKCHYIRPLHTL